MVDCAEIPYNLALDECADSIPDSRVGYAFENPDVDSDILFPGWGQIYTADELRYIDLMGTDLVSPANAQEVLDENLRFYVLQAISQVEENLEHMIFPRWVRYVNEREERDLEPPEGRPTDWIDPESRFIRESAYPLKVESRMYWNTFETNFKPVRRNENLRVDFLDIDRRVTCAVPREWIRLNGDGRYGQIQIVPGWLGTGAAGGQYIGFDGLFGYGMATDLPGTIGVDYDVGYAKAAHVPAGLREVIRKHAAWNLYQNYGTAKSPGIASASVSLNSVSESYSTTSTSTSSIFGAEMGRVENWLKDWYKRNAFKYRSPSDFVGGW